MRAHRPRDRAAASVGESSTSVRAAGVRRPRQERIGVVQRGGEGGDARRGRDVVQFLRTSHPFGDLVEVHAANSRRIASPWASSAGTARRVASASVEVTGEFTGEFTAVPAAPSPPNPRQRMRSAGAGRRTGPDGVSVIRAPRAADGAERSLTSVERAVGATRDVRSRATISSRREARPEYTRAIAASSAARFATRRSLEENRGSAASASCCRAPVQNAIHSRSSSGSRPPPDARHRWRYAPYGAMVG